MKFCQNCGAEIIDINSRYCEKCGCSLYNEQKKNGKSASSVIKSILVIIFVLIICFSICAYVVRRDVGIDDYDFGGSSNNYSSLNVKCDKTKEYTDELGVIYVEGSCKNNSSKNYDYLQVEYVCYNKNGDNLGTAIANVNNLDKGENWKFKALLIKSSDDKLDHCTFKEVAGF